MAFFDKFKFWKHEELPSQNIGLEGMEPGMGQGPNLGMDLGEGSFGDMDKPLYGYPQQQQSSGMSPFPQQRQQGYPPQGMQPGLPQGFQQQEYEPPVLRTFDHTKGPFQAPLQQEASQQQYMVDKNYEIISSKLDAVRAALESINQRLANLERMSQDQRRRGGW